MSLWEHLALIEMVFSGMLLGGGIFPLLVLIKVHNCQSLTLNHALMQQGTQFIVLNEKLFAFIRLVETKNL